MITRPGLRQQPNDKATEATEFTEVFMSDELTERVIGAAIEVHRVFLFFFFRGFSSVVLLDNYCQANSDS